jgi:hypothetical protein
MCKVLLHGRSEFEAYDCRITGNQVGVMLCYVSSCYCMI